MKIKKYCPYRENEKISEEVRDHCHLTGKHRGPAHSKCKVNFTQKQNNVMPFTLHNLSIYDCHLFFVKLRDRETLIR